MRGNRHPQLWAAIGLSLLCLTAVGVGVVHLARSRTVQLFGRLVARVDADQRVVALTFDDGPTPARCDEILETLRRHGAKATFFVMGAELEAAPEIGRRLTAAGHELGNHSYSHQHMVLKSQSFIRSEIERTDSLIRGAGEEGEIYFRPPYAWKLVGLPWFLSRTHRTTVMWDLEPESDPKIVGNADRIAGHVLDRVHPGSIVLLHVWYAGGEATRAALPTILDGLHARGYRCVTVRELLANSSP